MRFYPKRALWNRPSLLGLALLLGLSLAAPIQEIRFTGGDPVLQALARAALPFAEGDEPKDLEAARQAILETGFFRDVRLSLQDGVLQVELLPNPPIREIRLQAQAFPKEALLRFLEQNLALAPGVTYNPKRVAEAQKALAQAYREAGFPFLPQVEAETRETQEGVLLAFRVEETPEVKAVAVEGVSLLPEAEVLKPLEGLKGRFDFAKYQEALRAIAQAYEGAGYRLSGPVPEGSGLKEGILTVRIRELRVARVEGEGLDLKDFPLKAGEPLLFPKLLEGIQALARATGRIVDYILVPEEEGVAVQLRLGPEGGRIERVELLGVTAFQEETLLGLLRLRPGEVYTPALAQEDAQRIARRYQDQGYEVADIRFGYREGVYRLEVIEVRIAGYRLNWEGPHRTQEEVILRELPPLGSLFHIPTLRRSLASLMATGLLAEPPQVGVLPTEEPGQVLLALRLKEARTGLFQPAIGWSSLEGWSGSLSFRETNLFGLAHQVGAELSFIQNDARDNLSLSLSYTIPWLYLDWLDLKAVRSNIALSLFSSPLGNNKLLDGSTDTGWEFTERRTGGRLNLTRPLSRDFPNFRISLGLSALRTSYALEVYDPNAPCDATGQDANRPCDPPGSNTYKDTGYVQGLLPQSGWTFRLDTGLSYIDVDNPRFRTQGYEVGVATGVGLSFPDAGGRSAFLPIVLTGKTYLPLDEERRQALAFRLSGGALLGQAPLAERFYLSGGGSEALLLRGYDDRKYGGLSFATAGVEYRYDFRLSPQGGTNLYGILFLDLGLADNTGGVKWGAGVGIRLDLDVFGALLPSLQLDYAFSPEKPTGRIHFRIGPSF